MDTTETLVLLELTKSISIQSALLDIITNEPTHYKYSRLNLDTYTDEECVFEFRFQKDDIKMLVNLQARTSVFCTIYKTFKL